MDRTTGGMSVEPVGEIVSTKAHIHSRDLLNPARGVAQLQNLSKVCLHPQQTLGPWDHQELLDSHEGLTSLPLSVSSLRSSFSRHPSMILKFLFLWLINDKPMEMFQKKECSKTNRTLKASYIRFKAQISHFLFCVLFLLLSVPFTKAMVFSILCSLFPDLQPRALHNRSDPPTLPPTPELPSRHGA